MEAGTILAQAADHPLRETLKELERIQQLTEHLNGFAEVLQTSIPNEGDLDGARAAVWGLGQATAAIYECTVRVQRDLSAIGG
jgi:hypothetical protein